MAKRGPKPKPHSERIASGGARQNPERGTVHILTATPGPGYVRPVMPGGMSAEAELLWNTRVETYERRGQMIAGCEEQLANYCEALVALNRFWQAKETPPGVLLTSVLKWGGEFYETSASQHVSIRPETRVNPIADHLRAREERAKTRKEKA